MSAFGLLTAGSVEDVPKILQRVANGYRGNQGSRYDYIWQLIATDMNAYAWELHAKIAEWKKNPPKRQRVLLAE